MLSYYSYSCLLTNTMFAKTVTTVVHDYAAVAAFWTDYMSGKWKDLDCGDIEGNKDANVSNLGNNFKLGLDLSDPEVLHLIRNKGRD